MAENFYEMYLEEMELIRPLDQEEEKRVLAAAARADMWKQMQRLL